MNKVSVADLSVVATFDNSTSELSEMKLDGFASSLEFTDQGSGDTTNLAIADNDEVEISTIYNS